jgi:hypothetical protein
MQIALTITPPKGKLVTPSCDIGDCLLSSYSNGQAIALASAAVKNKRQSVNTILG